MKKLTQQQQISHANISRELMDLADKIESLRNEVTEAQTEYYDARSDAWREGENGQQYEAWKGTWEEDVEDALRTAKEQWDELPLTIQDA